MLELNNRQRTVLIDKLPDAANIAVGALFFGQFLSGTGFSFARAIVGLVLWAALVGWSVLLAREEEP